MYEVIIDLFFSIFKLIMVSVGVLVIEGYYGED